MIEESLVQPAEDGEARPLVLPPCQSEKEVKERIEYFFKLDAQTNKFLNFTKAQYYKEYIAVSAEDLLGMAWEKVLRRALKLLKDEKPTAFLNSQEVLNAYMHKTIIKLVISLGRRKNTVDYTEDDIGALAEFLPGKTASPFALVWQKERRQLLVESMKNLTEDQKNALTKRLEGENISDIASKLDKTPDAVKQLLARARANIRVKLGSYRQDFLEES